MTSAGLPGDVAKQAAHTKSVWALRIRLFYAAFVTRPEFILIRSD